MSARVQTSERRESLPALLARVAKGRAAVARAREAGTPAPAWEEALHDLEARAVAEARRVCEALSTAIAAGAVDGLHYDTERTEREVITGLIREWTEVLQRDPDAPELEAILRRAGDVAVFRGLVRQYRSAVQTLIDLGADSFMEQATLDVQLHYRLPGEIQPNPPQDW